MATYDEILDQLIEYIREDDTANSETVEALVARLRELNALGAAQFESRRINTGNGLAGGGDLSQDRTLSLAEGVLESLAKADDSVSTAGMTEALKAYVTRAQGDQRYTLKAEGKPIYVLPFTHPGTLNGSVESPAITLPRGGAVTHVSVSTAETGKTLTVNLAGGATGQVVLSAGRTSISEAVAVAVTGPLSVRLSSESARDVTVAVRVQEA